MNYTIYLVPVISFFSNVYLFSSPIISFYYFSDLDTDHIQKKIKQGNIHHYTINGLHDHPHYTGIFSTYGGFLQTSDMHGQTIFPRLHHQPSLYVVITDKLTPITMFENTIEHWELVPGTPTLVYHLERLYNDTNREFFWQVQLADLPTYPRIPLDTLVIFANAHDLTLHTDYQTTEPDPHLLLPNVYILKEIDIMSAALYILNIKHLFRPITFTYQVQPKQYEEIQNP
ncbi:MAG TPA: hypothetical protein VEK38_03065 [Candidatus Bathyarchaeia archaeon]|nr:hypothetical protein [Candidatus Bathyarchaeia archaeon]